MIEIELKECPFCGAAAKMKKLGVGMFSQAEKLGMSARWDVSCTADFQCVRVIEMTREDAVAAWNKRASNWQPIATAPKDCRSILLDNPAWGHRVLIGSWDETEQAWRVMGFGCPAAQPTNWQPLPAPPEVEG